LFCEEKLLVAEIMKGAEGIEERVRWMLLYWDCYGLGVGCMSILV
jgi:hypothetical protein